MLSLIITFFAATLSSVSNWSFRKKFELSDKTEGFLFYYYLITFFLAIFINWRVFFEPANFTMLGLGSLAGAMNVLVMYFTAEALKKGPSSLTFAFQNASCVFPSLLLALFFGEPFGYTFNSFQLLGIILVVFGLFMGSTQRNKKTSALWFFLAIACLGSQVLTLTFIQGRCILFKCQGMDHFLARYAVLETADVWFLPAQFGMAALLQGLLYLKMRNPLKKQEIKYAGLAGSLNGLSSFLLLLATKWAIGFENLILLPLFSVSVIILCNLWAHKLYGEKLYYTTMAACILGIFLVAIG